jgi:DNA-binding NtrC family response regulator/tetratricopeptide (TPR) repeat protein
MVGLAGRANSEASVRLLNQIRANVTTLGDAQTTAALHILLGETEAKRGLIQSARRHTEVGLGLLGGAMNLWLRALAQNTLVAISIMRCELQQGIEQAQRGLDAAEESGAAAMIRALVANLGNLYFLAGDFDRASQCFERSAALSPSSPACANGSLDSLARVALTRCDHNVASKYLSQVDSSIRADADRTLYPNRYAQLTASELLMQRNAWREAKAKIDEVVELAVATHDQFLLALSRARRIEILSRHHDFKSAEAEATDLAKSLNLLPPEISAHYERAYGSMLCEWGRNTAGLAHFRRAASIFLSLHNTPGHLECERLRQQYQFPKSMLDGTRSAILREIEPDPLSLAGCIIQDVAGLLIHAGHPELLGREGIEILLRLGAISSAELVANGSNGPREVLVAVGQVHTGEWAENVSLGFDSGRAIELRYEPQGGLETRATLNAVQLLLATVRDLECARTEREERQTLWPIEELPIEDENAIVHGKMRAVMIDARKVAPLDVAVLITGESGTGKEVLAQAIHRASPRAAKPFVPINCTAVPRELLESQLFGHRRGAFTGADRDSLGMIRTARGGTLFLDEIGELGLDVQPKLLRFLESGEIAPLGEPTPQRVDVRIIAATNANLEALVAAGRFRADLFYRLNVVRVSIPPLRERRDEIPPLVHHLMTKAASEFGKGHIQVSENAMEHLILYDWPGNVRELQNELRRITAFAEPDTVLDAEVLSPQILGATPVVHRTNGSEIAVPLHHKLSDTIAHVEREMIQTALRTHNGHFEAAARALGISRKGLYLKRQRLGL